MAFEIAHAGFGLGGRGLDPVTNEWLYDTLLAGAAAVCLARGLLVRNERTAWLLLGAGLLCNAGGEIYYSLAFGESGNPPTPSISDALNLAYYPCVYVGLMLLVRGRLARYSASAWLDGAVAATTTAAFVAALALDPIVQATKGSLPAVATNLAYPVGDLVLLSMVVLVPALAGWRPGRAWLLLGVGLLASGVADTLYAYQNATGSYTVGTWIDSLWPASTMAVAFAAWTRPAPAQVRELAGMRQLLIPGAFALAALGLLIYGGLDHVPGEALALAGASLLLVIARAAWTFAENLRLLAESRRDAVTDLLTGLGNRRRLMADLERACAAATPTRPRALVMFDLDGFKVYNDSFGHMAGDELLAHLGRTLAEAVVQRGNAYRLGGDEFCVLLDADAAQARPLIAAALTALTSAGEGFAVKASHGEVTIPHEARSSLQALRLADDRMYAQKGDGRRSSSARQQAHDVLLGVLRERQPELHEHLREVGRLALAVGRRMHVGAEQLDELTRAAELHDIGKAAIPDEILDKKGPLNDHEWAFMRRHTIIGERILAAAPALGPVAALVRSSHERFDGGGYPDNLEGEQIPLGARIICACDAFDAMVSQRPYARAMRPEQALEELRRCAGSQFDPAVVQALAAEWRSYSRGELDGEPHAGLRASRAVQASSGRAPSPQAAPLAAGASRAVQTSSGRAPSPRAAPRPASG